jgi:hypothetical protein
MKSPCDVCRHQTYCLLRRAYEAHPVRCTYFKKPHYRTAPAVIGATVPATTTESEAK